MKAQGRNHQFDKHPVHESPRSLATGVYERPVHISVSRDGDLYSQATAADCSRHVSPPPLAMTSLPIPSSPSSLRSAALFGGNSVSASEAKRSTAGQRGCYGVDGGGLRLQIQRQPLSFYLYLHSFRFAAASD